MDVLTTPHAAALFGKGFPPGVTEEAVDRLAQRYRLARVFHARDALSAAHTVGFAGHNVLEAGGRLLPAFTRAELGARHWLSVLPDPDQVMGVYRAEGFTAGYEPTAIIAQDGLPAPADLPYGTVVDARLQDLPAAWSGCFDRIYTANTMEHVLGMGSFLEAAHRLLKPGGRLYACWQPFWPGPFGSHNGRVTDPASGAVIDCPPWGHLAMTPQELYAWARSRTDAETADRLVFHVHHNPDINRYFMEDYFSFFAGSAFTVDEVIGLNPITVPPDLLATISRRFPGRQGFGFQGLATALTRP